VAREVNKDYNAKGLTVASSLTLLISETWMEACNRSLRPEPSSFMSEIARLSLVLWVEACHWCISSRWLATKEVEKGEGSLVLSFAVIYSSDVFWSWFTFAVGIMRVERFSVEGAFCSKTH
jgi:hypothetical protein